MGKNKPAGVEKAEQDKRVGRSGERMAALWLRLHGYCVIARNWRSGRDELDIVAKKRDTLSFVEVKTRTCTDPAQMAFGSPASFVDTRKQTALLRASRAFLASHPEETQNLYIRMDVMEVYRIRHPRFPIPRVRVNLIENAFGAD